MRTCSRLASAREDASRLRKLVEQEKRKGKKDSSPSERGVDSFKTVRPTGFPFLTSKVQHYAEKTTLCRHVAICRFFGEKIDEKDKDIAKRYCDGMCDVSGFSTTRSNVQVCKDSMKVQVKAQDLTEEFDVASQRVTSNEDTARFEDPVRDPRAWPGYSLMVEENTFYGQGHGHGRSSRPLLAEDITSRRANTPVVPSNKKQKVVADSPYNLSAGIRAASASTGRVPWAKSKAATPVRLGREIEREAAAGKGYLAHAGPPRELMEADELPLVRGRSIFIFHLWLIV